MLLAAIFLAGVLGALTRFGVNTVVLRRWHAEMPVGTFVVNVSGSFLLGVVTGYTMAAVNVAETSVQVVVGTGFLGAYTTFATEELETLARFREGSRFAGSVLLGGLVASLALGALGLWIGAHI